MKRIILAFGFWACLLPNISGQSAFYEPSVIQKIEVWFSQPNWDYMLDTARYGKDGSLMAQWVKVNGLRFDSVGVKYKGSSSYDSTYAKNPVHIELNTYKDQDYEGFTDIKLNNNYADPSMMREVMAYEITRTYMDAPQANFAKLYINGQYRGLYTNAESINKSFLSKHFYSSNGTFVKCNPNLTPSPNVKSNLKYITADSSSYFNYYEMKSDYGWKNLAALCDSVSNKAGNIESILDMDRATWMLAFNNVLVNLDSYCGAFAQNYYLYKDRTGRFSPITWDLNMSFAGFPFLGSSNTSLGSLSISSAMSLPLNVHATDPYWPLLVAVHSNPLYKRMYLAHVRTLVNEMFASNLYMSKYNTYKTLIDSAVLGDNNKFYSYTQFQNALSANISVGSYSVPGIQTLMNGRVSYLQATADFTYSAPSIANVAVSGTAQINQPATITASVSNGSTVYLMYRFARSQKFNRVAMYDDGAHNDGAAGDNVYGAAFTLTASSVQYYVYAENSLAGKFAPERAAHEFYSLSLYSTPLPGQLVINEFLADNKSDVRNEFHLHEDWLELFNNTSSTLSLDGYFLSDDAGAMSKYAFPVNTLIQPYGYLTVWADNMGIGQQLHAGFKLNNDYGKLMLSDGGYTLLDSYSYGRQENDVSMGRCPDGYGNFKALKYPSYGSSNCVVGIEEEALVKGISLFPNPASGSFKIQAADGVKQKVRVCSVGGSLMYQGELEQSLVIDCSGWTGGIYIVTCGAAAGKIIVSN